MVKKDALLRRANIKKKEKKNLAKDSIPTHIWLNIEDRHVSISLQPKIYHFQVENNQKHMKNLKFKFSKIVYESSIILHSCNKPLLWQVGLHAVVGPYHFISCSDGIFKTGPVITVPFTFK